MASTSGTKGPFETDWKPTKRLVRAPTRNVDLGKADALDSEAIPSSLAVLVPILRAAIDIEEENPIVAYLCRLHAFEMANEIDPTSSGHGVLQFKTNLSYKLKKEEKLIGRKRIWSEIMELQNYYQQFCEKRIRDGEFTQRPEETARNVQFATVLYEVLKTMVPPQSIEDKIKMYAENVERMRGQYEHYNILPLYAVGVIPPIMELPEIKAAINALRNVDNLPMYPVIKARPDGFYADSTMPMERRKKVDDIIDWVGSVFGFQKGNVANQREHLILLLANLNIRNNHITADQLHDDTVKQLTTTIFKNYESWCLYVRCTSNIRRVLDDYDMQHVLICVTLYLLIWGEASNIRFMPECICYIFHNMCCEVFQILDKNLTGSTWQVEGRDDEYFLREVISPIYRVVLKEAKRSNNGKASHSNWRNYDDLNEYFWSNKCFNLGWPLNVKADFFRNPDQTQTVHRGRSQASTKFKRKLKNNFVEVRTFMHLYRSFDRMWIFFLLALQVMIITAWSSLGPIGVFFDADSLKNVMTIFITYAFLIFLQATLDIILLWNSFRNMTFAQSVRYFLKFVVAAVWVVVLPLCHFSHLQFVPSWNGVWGKVSLYTYVVVLYMLPNIMAAVIFFLPPLRKTLEQSNMRIITFFMWWAQPKLYVGRGMHENMFSVLRYTLFWIMVLSSKLAFSYYVEILPLVEPTKLIMRMSINNQQLHVLFPENEAHNIFVVIAIWAPIILVYFLDTQLWYSIYATLFGVIVGAFGHLGKIQTLEMLHSRFQSIPLAFSQRFWTGEDRKTKQVELDETYERNKISYFSQFWNEFINSMREEDRISDRDRDLLLIPYSSTDVSVIQWPLFLLANKIPTAVQMAKDYEETDDDLSRKIRSDEYMCSAVVECYESLKDIILNLLLDEIDRLDIGRICAKVERCIREETFVKEFKMSGLPSLVEKFREFLTQLYLHQHADEKLKSQIIVNVLQDIVETIIYDVMVDGHLFLQTPHQVHAKRGERFVNINTSLTHKMTKVNRLLLLLSVKESAINVPQNLEAQRRIKFFANSLLFTNMPKAPKVRDMLSFSVLTPYFKEDILYTDEELNKENEDGISILLYLIKIYPDEWINFHERLKGDSLEKDMNASIRRWASYRGQTLYRTVKGMMYYWEALILQCFIEFAGDTALSEGFRTEDFYSKNKEFLEKAQAIADSKFTYVLSCPRYGDLKKSENESDRSRYISILSLMLTHSPLRVAYIDEREETVNGKSQNIYYSVLVKGREKYDEEIYRIKLPGPPTVIGEWNPESQNHAIIFTRGEALQTRDMNQENYYEESFKMRNVLEEFKKGHSGQRKPTILGITEHLFTGSVSSLAWFRAKQEASFVSIGQRMLANPLRVRFHYGHSDIFDRIFHITRGGISKASRAINLSGDIFAGFNSTLRQGFITHHEYIQVGKGNDAGMNQISRFEAHGAVGNGQQTLSRDVYRLAQRFDFFRMLSFYFTTVGLYFSSMVTVLIVYLFLYGRLYMVLSGVEREILQSINKHQSKALEEALTTQSVVQSGLLLMLPMVMEIGLEKGFRTALVDFIFMQMQLASVFFTFQLGTRAHYYGRTLLHGGAKYRPTGRGFVPFHVKFADNYRMYSRSHFVKGLEILILMIFYNVYGESYHSSHLYLFITISMWFLTASWLFAPFLFNPSAFDLKKLKDDWIDWKQWLDYRGGIGISSDKSWESWWDEENNHLKYSTFRGKLIEIILAFRFFIYQYAIVCHMYITRNKKNLLVFGISWAVLIIMLIDFKILSAARGRYGTDIQLMFRILEALHSLAFIVVMIVLFVTCGLTVSDLFAALIASVPCGWAIIQIAQICRVFLKGCRLWASVEGLSRTYEYIMGSVIFMPIYILSWFPYISEFQTRLLFSQAYSRGLQISKNSYQSDWRN